MYPRLYGKTLEHYKEKKKVANALKPFDGQLTLEENKTLFNE